METCTLLTTTPNAVLQAIHDRMPVILPPDAYSVWLDPTMREVEPVQTLLTPHPAEEKVAYRVSTRVNNPANDTADCIAPLG